MSNPRFNPDEIVILELLRERTQLQRTIRLNDTMPTLAIGITDSFDRDRIARMISAGAVVAVADTQKSPRPPEVELSSDPAVARAYDSVTASTWDTSIQPGKRRGKHRGRNGGAFGKR